MTRLLPAILALAALLPGWAMEARAGDVRCAAADGSSSGTLTCAAMPSVSEGEWRPVEEGLGIQDLHVREQGTPVATDSKVILHLRAWDQSGRMLLGTQEAADVCCGPDKGAGADAGDRLLRTNSPVHLVLGVGNCHPDLEKGLLGMREGGRRMIRLGRLRAATAPLIYGKQIESGDAPDEVVYLEVTLIAVRAPSTGRIVRFR